MGWLLCDYGEVLCRPPTPEDRGALEAVAGVAGEQLWERYWTYRLAYDRADLTTEQYWTEVIGRRPGGTALSRLLELDIAGWLHPDEAVLAAARRAADAGFRLAVLSNAPLDHAAVYDRTEWLAPFSPRLFSSRLGMVKPEPAIFEETLKALGARPSEVIFIDDRPANVEGARRAGIRAEQFQSAAQIDRIVATARRAEAR